MFRKFSMIIYRISWMEMFDYPYFIRKLLGQGLLLYYIKCATTIIYRRLINIFDDMLCLT